MLISGMILIAGIAIFAFAMSLHALIELKAMQRSTHRMTYINPTGEFSPLSDEEKKKLQEDFFQNMM